MTPHRLSDSRQQVERRPKAPTTARRIAEERSCRSRRFDDHLSVYTCPQTGLEFAAVEAGEFDIGDLWDDSSGFERRPVHRVRIASFQFLRTPVTQAMWRRIMGNNPAEFFGTDFVGDDKPVVGVSWEGVQDFIQRLN